MPSGTPELHHKFFRRHHGELGNVVFKRKNNIEVRIAQQTRKFIGFGLKNRPTDWHIICSLPLKPYEWVEEEDNNDNDNFDDPKSGDQLLVKFPTKKTIKFYVGCIEELVPGEELELRFVRNCDGFQFKYPEVEDILEKKWECKGTVHQLFIDFKKAYDSVKRKVLYNILIEFGIPKKLVRLIKMCLSETYSRFRIGQFLSDAFPIHCGLKQGDALSPSLFNFALEYAIRKLQDNRQGLELNRLHQFLVYADDVNMLGENRQMIRENMEILLGASKAIGLGVNPEKTKYMIMSRDQNIVRNGNIKIGDLSFEEVKKFKYLGATLDFTLREEQRLRVYEKKVLRKIFGAKRDEVTGEWRKLHNTAARIVYFT
ncbi:hypothetical protein ANN_17794 [Periplaneta americana]|uniref:Reverse transcriptase domain-containing protein n=1 Tax=Periplaneta americana TaxID=6978 RepID=A0ABQ8STZ1_PERAM|nr:hypothetical protein ANN_17794 [Periplaneta americana]